MTTNTVLVTGGTGKTGGRVARRLAGLGLPVRIGSRSGAPPFDCDDPAGWENFSEGFLADAVAAGVIAFPAGEVAEPFVDVEDLADLAVHALTAPEPWNRVVEVTGPRLLTFAGAAAELSAAAGRPVAYVPVPVGEFVDGAVAEGVPAELAADLGALFGAVLDGRNASVVDGVGAVLGRPARDFTAYARAAAATGVWSR